MCVCVWGGGGGEDDLAGKASHHTCLHPGLKCLSVSSQPDGLIKCCLDVLLEFARPSPLPLPPGELLGLPGLLQQGEHFAQFCVALSLVQYLLFHCTAIILRGSDVVMTTA